MSEYHRRIYCQCFSQLRTRCYNIQNDRSGFDNFELCLRGEIHGLRPTKGVNRSGRFEVPLTVPS